jgi:hypothetical protein
MPTRRSNEKRGEQAAAKLNETSPEPHQQGCPVSEAVEAACSAATA